jgi:hypothetical protein
VRPGAETEQRFYRRCAEILGLPHDYAPFTHDVRTRWNNRRPGSGRFPGGGLVRLFGDRVHVALRQPVAVNRWFDDKDEALVFLERIARQAKH